jgi:hypothetical protein
MKYPLLAVAARQTAPAGAALGVSAGAGLPIAEKTLLVHGSLTMARRPLKVPLVSA